MFSMQFSLHMNNLQQIYSKIILFLSDFFTQTLTHLTVFTYDKVKELTKNNYLN